MSMEENSYYDVLGVDENVSDSEIKKAYAKKIREYPPEKDPTNFQKIRQAYETLIDPRTRQQYTETLKFNNYVNDLARRAAQAMDNGDYQNASMYLNQALEKAPSLDYLRNMLGICYLNINQYDRAKKEFLRLVQDYPRNALYLSNLGYTLYLLKDYINAERYLQKSIELNPVDLYSPLTLANLYIDQKNYSKASDLLERCVLADGKLDFQDILFLLKLLDVYILKGDKTALQRVFERIKTIVPEDDGVKKYVAFEIGRISADLFKVGIYDLSAQIADWALTIYNAQELRAIRDEARKFDRILYQFNKLTNDNRFRQGFKAFIAEFLSESIFGEKANNMNLNDMLNNIALNPQQLVEEIKMLKNDYNSIYTFFNEIMNNLFENILSEYERTLSRTPSYSQTSGSSSSSYYSGGSSSANLNSSDSSTGSSSYRQTNGSSSGGCLLPIIFVLSLLLIFVV